MLLRREKPNIYSFNLMLKCTKECNFGTQEDILEALSILAQNIAMNKAIQGKPLHIEHKAIELEPLNDKTKLDENVSTDVTIQGVNLNALEFINEKEKRLALPQAIENSIPNLLSKNIQINEVVSIKEVETPQERFEFIGGASGFLKEMKVYNVSPDFKTMAQMVFLIPGNEEAEKKLFETAREYGIWVDIEFYNTLIRKRCLRFDYEGALAVRELIDAENKYRKKKHPMRRRIILKYNLLTYGALAMTCKTKEDAIQMIGEMEEEQLKINIEILGAMLSQAASRVDLDYATYIMEKVKSLSLKPNEVFLNHLTKISLKGRKRKQLQEEGIGDWTEENVKEYIRFCKYHRRWLKEIVELDSSKFTADWFKLKIEPEHPWSQFKENQPESVQRQNLIKPPKRYFKRKKHPKPYKP